MNGKQLRLGSISLFPIEAILNAFALMMHSRSYCMHGAIL